MQGEIAGRLPPIHRDPLDRMLIASAKRADLTVITCDTISAEWGVHTVC
jgi:PIN domain nuclease of toxin-antitoxin system